MEEDNILDITDRINPTRMIKLLLKSENIILGYFDSDGNFCSYISSEMTLSQLLMAIDSFQKRKEIDFPAL